MIESASLERGGNRCSGGRGNANWRVIILAVLGAFVVGFAAGAFVTGNAIPPAPMISPMATSAPVSEKIIERLETGHETAIDRSSGESLVSRVWGAMIINDENARHAEWLSLLPTITAGNAEEVRELFRDAMTQGRRVDLEWTAFWRRWGEVDGGAAIAHVHTKERAEDQSALAEMVLRGWVKARPEAARGWLAANTTEPLYDAAVRGYVDGLASRDLTRATAMLSF
jgi:hypothetical protein